MNEIKLNLNVDDVNIILYSLSVQPYKDVVNLIDKIKHDANSQINNEENK